MPAVTARRMMPEVRLPKRLRRMSMSAALYPARKGQNAGFGRPWRRVGRVTLTILGLVAKDTEKLIRQLSLISFLMAQGRPVSALEIKREVEGYSYMNADAFARRFYADRADLESLGIQLGVEKPGEGFFEAELYSLPPENFYLDPISFS